MLPETLFNNLSLMNPGKCILEYVCDNREEKKNSLNNLVIQYIQVVQIIAALMLVQ